MSNFTFQEAIPSNFQRHIRPQFDLAQTPSSEAIFIRLLVGTLKVTNTFSTDSFDQFKNYSILGAPTNTPVSTKSIKECIEPESTLEKLCEHLDANKTINKTFHETLLEEVASYFYKTAKHSHTTGFLHLYRTLEFISYSFPLIYASISREYYGSFNKLKNYFVDGSKSELVFFDEFVSKLLDSALLATPLTFNFNTLSTSVNHNHFVIIKNIVDPANITSEVQDVSITTTYKHLIKLTIDLRNRYFHFAIGGQRNIRPTEIIENDRFFSIVNEELLNWISMIYFEILKEVVSSR